MAMIGILLGFVILVVGFLIEGPKLEAEPSWNKKPLHRKLKKRVRPIHRAA
jgi:hypothetical protein